MSDTAPRTGAVEHLARNDRLIVLGAICLIVLLAGLYTIYGAGMQMTALDMTRMARPIGQPMAMGGAQPWTPAYALLIFLMWWIMMIAMMVPSAAPMLLLFTAVKKAGADTRQAHRDNFLFLCGYLLAWCLFSALATALQWELELVGLSNGPMMTVSSRALAGGMLIAAGLYQVTPLKQACLSHCRSPANFLTRHKRSGALGALTMGLHHGAYCLGCCWALMILLFVGGVMNLYWIVGLALIVLTEKLLPHARAFAAITGSLMTGVGGYVLITGL